MKDIINTKAHTLVLETMLGDNPYNSNYPRDLIITLARDNHGSIRRVFLALYAPQGTYWCEIKQLYTGWLEDRHSIHNDCQLIVERPMRERIKISSRHIRQAFLAVARELISKDQSRIDKKGHSSHE